MEKEEIEKLAEDLSGTYWDYRWLKIEVEVPEYDDNLEPTGKTEIEYYYALHEVYYNDNEKPFMWTENPVKFQIDDADDLISIINQCLNAAMEKVLLLKDNTITELDEYMDKYEILNRYRKEN